MPLLIFCVLGSILVYFGTSFLIGYYTKSDNPAINKASRVLSVGFALFVLSMYCERILPGRAGQWTELSAMTIICIGSLTVTVRILAKSRKCPK